MHIPSYFWMYGRSQHVGPLLRAARRPRLAVPSAAALENPRSGRFTLRTLCVLHSENKNPAYAGLFLFLDVRQKPHEASALYRLFHHALLLCRETALAAIHNATMRIDEVLQEIDILVVDVLNVVLRQNVIRCHIC